MASEDSPVTVYWRPGCPYCMRLRRGLRRAGLPVSEVNIWSDAKAAAKVRAIAGGNETVPTVLVGEKGLVNPTVAQVLDALGALAPDLVPRRTDGVGRPALARAVKWLRQWTGGDGR